MRLSTIAAALALTVAGVSCMDPRRINTECRWVDDRADVLDLSQPRDRDHLRIDAKVAGDLGLRLADVRYRNVPTLARPIHARCARAMEDSIIARHRVTRPQIDTARHARLWWADILAVFLPMFFVVVAAMSLATQRVCRQFAPGDGGIAATMLALVIPLVAAIGLGATQFWSVAVEGWTLRNGHVSYRAFETPAVAHGWITYFILLGVCAVTGVLRYRATPLQDASHAPRYARARAAR